jgi:hypothetical protein
MSSDIPNSDAYLGTGGRSEAERPARGYTAADQLGDFLLYAGDLAPPRASRLTAMLLRLTILSILYQMEAENSALFSCG